jgi:hypothetical protein
MSLMLPKPKTTACARCGVSDTSANMIEATRFDADGAQKDIVCGPCWWNPGGAKAPAPARVVPAPRALPADPRAVFAATSHKTLEAAQARAAKVAHVLGVLPDITPADPSAPGPFFVCPDSPLVDGFKAAKNPYGN